MSYGATCALFLAAIDDRVRAAIVACYLSSWRAAHTVPWNMCGSQILPGQIKYIEHPRCRAPLIALGALLRRRMAPKISCFRSTPRVRPSIRCGRVGQAMSVHACRRRVVHETCVALRAAPLARHRNLNLPLSAGYDDWLTTGSRSSGLVLPGSVPRRTIRSTGRGPLEGACARRVSSSRNHEGAS